MDESEGGFLLYSENIEPPIPTIVVCLVKWEDIEQKPRFFCYCSHHCIPPKSIFHQHITVIVMRSCQVGGVATFYLYCNFNFVTHSCSPGQSLKSKNSLDSKIFHAKTFRMKRVNCDTLLSQERCVKLYNFIFLWQMCIMFKWKVSKVLNYPYNFWIVWTVTSYLDVPELFGQFSDYPDSL